MALRTLQGFVSYKDSKDFLSYLQNNELTISNDNSPEGEESDIGKKIEKNLVAARKYHATRVFEVELKTESYLYAEGVVNIENLSKADYLGVLYLSDVRIGDIEILPYDEYLESDILNESIGPKLIAIWSLA